MSLDRVHGNELMVHADFKQRANTRWVRVEMFKFAAILIGLALSTNTALAQISIPAYGNIATMAGNGTAGYSGDSGLATSAELNAPVAVAVDQAGNVYVADELNARVRKITASTGVVTTIAGTGVAGYSGDGGLATSAKLNYPSGIAVDQSNNVYIADNGNARVRKITASTGIITTIAGTGAAGYDGDGKLATASPLNYPVGVALDQYGNIYIADKQNFIVRKVTVATGIITTIAGTPGKSGYRGDGGLATSAALFTPWGVTIDSSSNVYIVDSNGHRVRKVTVLTGIITTIAGTGIAGYSGDGGLATSAQLDYPARVAIDSSGNLYIADGSNNRIRKVTASTGIITTIVGTGAAGYSGDGGLATGAKLSSPAEAAFDQSGNIYIADTGNNRVRVVGEVKITPTVSLASSLNPSAYGSTITFTATVPSGDTNAVTFYNGATSLGAITPSNGVATLSTSSLGVGSYSVTASIAAGGSYNGATSSALTQVVNGATPSITLSSSAGSTTYGSLVTFTAAVPATDTNQVTFKNGSTVLGTVTPSNGTATLATSAIPAGANSVTATIAAGGSYNGATSSAITLTVSQATPALTLTSSSNPSLYGSALTFTATAPSADGNAVTFYNGSAAMGYATPSNGVATLTVSNLSIGSVSITARIAAGGNFTVATSNAIAQVINKSVLTVKWPTPSAISFGSPLSSAQLNATANIPGTFAYSPAAGAVLLPGTDTLSVTFTPSDSVDYSAVTMTVPLVVDSGSFSCW